MPLNVALVIVGLVGLLYGGDSLVRGSARLASSLGVSPTVVGLTVVAFGTSVPELLVSLSAAARGSSDIALGNVLGSNIANVGLIIGVTALVYPLSVHWRLIRREIPLMVGVQPEQLQFEFPATIIFAVLVIPFALDRRVVRREGLIFLLLYMGFITATFLRM